MRILHIDESFHTQYGYHTAPIAKEQVKLGHEVFVLTVEADKLYPVFSEFGDNTSQQQILEYDREFEKEYGVKIVRCKVFGYISYRAVYKNEIYRIIDNINPDVIFCHNSDSLMAIRLILRKEKYPTMYDSHMLEMASENKFSKLYLKAYRLIVSPILRKRKSIIVRTQDDPYIIDKEQIPKEQAPFISFGTDTTIFHPDKLIRKRFREENDIGLNDFVVVYTGKLNKEKGADLLAEVTKAHYDVGQYSGIVFLIVGNTKGEYGENIERAFSSSNNRILRFPSQKYTELAQFYQASDLSVFPKQCSMSFYDAQACGLPVLSEDNSVNVDRCSNSNGFNFVNGNADSFISLLQKILVLQPDEYKKYSINAQEFIAKNYSYSSIAKEYTEMLTKVYENSKA